MFFQTQQNSVTLDTNSLVGVSVTSFSSLSGFYTNTASLTCIVDYDFH